MKTEAIVLRSIRYGEADRILHLYTPARGRVSAIAKGVRKAQVALRRAPGAVLPARPRALPGPQRPADRDLGRDPRRAIRACASTAARSTAPRAPARPSRRIFDDGEPHAGVYHLLANELALLDREPEPRRPRQRARLPPEAAARRRLRAAARRLRLLRRARAPRRLLRRRRRRRLRRLRGQLLPARRGGARLHGRPRSAARWPRPRTPRRRALAQAERAIIETLEHHAHLRLRPVGSRGRSAVRRYACAARCACRLLLDEPARRRPARRLLSRPSAPRLRRVPTFRSPTGKLGCAFYSDAETPPQRPLRLARRRRPRGRARRDRQGEARSRSPTRC